MREIGAAHFVRVGSRHAGGLLDVAHALAPEGFDPARDGICIQGSGTILYACPVFQSLLGNDGASVIGRDLVSLVAAGDGPLLAALLDGGGTTAGGGPVRVHPRGRASEVDMIRRRADHVVAGLQVIYAGPARGHAGASGQNRGDPSRSGPFELGSRRPTVLICDDESRLSALTAGLLSEYGFESVTVGTGDDAIRHLQEGDVLVDVVLLDVNLAQGASAQDVLLGMDATGSEARVILTSGLAEEDLDPELISHPCVVGYVAKPYAVEQLVQSIRQALMTPAAEAG